MSKQQEAPGALEVVREFVNTADLEEGTDELHSPDALADWLVKHDLAASGLSATRNDLKRAVELREALRATLLSHNGVQSNEVRAAEIVDSAVRRADVRLRFEPSGEPILRPQARGVDGALGTLLAIVHAAVADGTWERLKACRDHTCEWAFYDNTKNRSGAWCSMAVCGNRAKARAYRQRRGRGEGS